MYDDKSIFIYEMLRDVNVSTRARNIILTEQSITITTQPLAYFIRSLDELRNLHNEPRRLWFRPHTRLFIASCEFVETLIQIKTLSRPHARRVSAPNLFQSASACVYYFFFFVTTIILIEIGLVAEPGVRWNSKWDDIRSIRNDDANPFDAIDTYAEILNGKESRE